MLVVKHGLEQVKKGWKAMIDYEKAEQAKKLLKESGVPCILAYAKSNEAFNVAMEGTYLEIKNFVTAVMLETVKELNSDYGHARATLEAWKITSEVLTRLDKKEEAE